MQGVSSGVSVYFFQQIREYQIPFKSDRKVFVWQIQVKIAGIDADNQL